MRNRFQVELYTLLGLCTLLLSLISIASCQKKGIEGLELGEMQEYIDPGIGFTIKYPKGWFLNVQVGRAYFYNATGVEMKFLDPQGSHPPGVVIALSVKKTTDAAAIVRQIKEELIKTGSTVGTENTVTIGNYRGVKLSYSASAGNKHVLHGYHVLIATDSAVYDLGAAGFDGYFDRYAEVFEMSLNSFQLPRSEEKGTSEF